MGLFSSKSSTQTETTSQNAGFSEIGGSATSINLNLKDNRSGTVNVLDGGAITKAFDFAGAAQSQALKQVELAGAQSAALVKESIAAVSESARNETENVTLAAVKWGALALIAWAVAGALRRGGA
jgi:hypothetical protein